MATRQRPWALGMAILSVLLLSLPSAVAVFQWLSPIRGAYPATAAALGFELTYLSLACLIFMTPQLQRSARRLQLWAVVTAISLNALESYSKRQGIDLSTGYAAWTTFDPWLLILSVGESIPLAGLAFGVAMIVHQLVAHDYLQVPAVNRLPWLIRLRLAYKRALGGFPKQPQRVASSQEPVVPSGHSGFAGRGP